MTQLSNTFTGAKHPRWGELSNDQKIEIREEWVNGRMIASGDPRNQKLYQQLVKEAYADLPQEAGEEPPAGAQALLHGVAGGIPIAPILASVFGVGPKSLQERGALILRGFQIPREMMWRSFKEIGEGEGTLPKQIGRAATQTAKYAREGGEEVRLPEELEKVPLSSLWSDPLIWGVGKQIGHLGVKGVKQLTGRVTGRIRPPTGKFPSPTTGEAAEAFNQAKLAEEAARREALKGRIREIGAREEAVGPPKSQIPAPRGPYNKAIIRLTPHFPRDEAKIVSEFVARHPDDVLSKTILSKKTLSPQTVSEIERRIFNRIPISPTVPSGIKPPTLTEPSIAEELNRPGKYADVIEAMGD